MKKILFVSGVTPYDNIGHAGGKTINCYIKGLAKVFDITLVSLMNEEDRKFVDTEKYNIRSRITFEKKTTFNKILNRILNWSYFFNWYDSYANLLPYSQKKALLTEIKKLKNEGYVPDYIQLEYTDSVLLTEDIKVLFPTSKIIASEHDVSFLGLKRKLEYEKNSLNKRKAIIRYNICRKQELKALEMCDMVLTHNVKDEKLLKENFIMPDKIHSIVPYFMQLRRVVFNKNSNKIVFFGAMARKENYLSAIWFIKNVMPYLYDYTFYIIGGNPPECLKCYSSKSIVVTGYVENIENYFSDALCLVAPLVLGAGIKVKILEGMSSGLVTLTNEIGIEGIPARAGKQYLHCEKAEEYVTIIQKLKDGSINGNEIATNAVQLIEDVFNIKKSVDEYIDILNEM